MRSKSIAGAIWKEFRGGRLLTKRPTRRRFITCSRKPAAPTLSARRRRLIPARSTARDRPNEPIAARRFGRAAAGGVVCRLAYRRRAPPAGAASGRLGDRRGGALR